MKPQRLTREQSRDQTRERLLNAAHRIFMKKGYVAASVEDIAAAAGFTRGAFYSNFSSKSDLLLELLERDHAEVQADFQAIFDGGGTREQMESMSLAYYRTLFQDDEYSLLWGEAKLQAARDAKFRVRFNQFLHGKRLQMAEFIRSFSERAGTPLLLPVENRPVSARRSSAGTHRAAMSCRRPPRASARLRFRSPAGVRPGTP